MEAQPMINCPKCGAERPDMILPWCPRTDCPSSLDDKRKTETLKTENADGKD